MPDLWPKILAAPHDKDLQAQFIATLTESHDPRAEIFRLAAELEKFPFYYVQHAELMGQYLAALAPWRPQFDTPAKTWNAQVTFVQGWPIELTIAAQDFLTHAPAIIATIPLRHLNLKSIAAAPDIFQLPQFAQIASLSATRQSWTGPPVRALADSPHLTSLRWLDLTHTLLTDADVEILAASPHLRQIEHIELAHNPCRNPVDASEGCGRDGITGLIVPESIWLPDFGRELESRHGKIHWLHALDHYMEKHPPNRYLF